MNKVQHPSNNFVLGAPKDWDQKVLPCSALPITLSRHDDITHMQSFWRPTEQELRALNAGGFVRLTVLGSSHPPVSLEVEHG